MVVALSSVLLTFIIGLVVSAIIIFIATKLFGEQEGFTTALLAAFIGAIIYAIAYYFLGGGILATLIGGVAWLLALGSLYNMGWLKAFIVALVIWVLAAIISYVLPTAAGPL